MKMRLTNEAKTGILVLVCLLALLGLILKVGNFTLLQKGYYVKAHLHYAAGIKKNAPVHLSGVNVGEVKDIHVLYGDEAVIELTLWMQDGVKLRKDSLAQVATLGLMGEKFIDIKAGTSQAEYAKDGDLIPAEDPVRLEDLIKLGTKIADDVDKMAKDISSVAKNVDRAVVDNRPKIDHIFDNLEDTSDNFREFSEDIKWHPWKVLAKGKEKSEQEKNLARAERLEARAKALKAGA